MSLYNGVSKRTWDMLRARDVSTPKKKHPVSIASEKTNENGREGGNIRQKPKPEFARAAATIIAATLRKKPSQVLPSWQKMVKLRNENRTAVGYTRVARPEDI